ncbi:MAG: glycosyltransferase family 9 protein [Candidatus Omnitrophota bacterium]
MYIYKKKIYIVLFSIVDLIGTVLMFSVRFFRKNQDKRSEKILIIRADHIGDVVAATSVLGPLKRAYPEAEIDFLAPSWAKVILGENPYIKSFVEFDAPWFSRKRSNIMSWLEGINKMANIIKDRGYDTVIDLRGDFRQITAMFLAGVKNRISYGITGGGFLLTQCVRYKLGLHETERNTELLKPLGIESPISEPEIYLSEKDKSKAELLKKETGINNKYAVIHMVPGHSTKKWDINKFRKVARYIRKEKKLKTVFVGSIDDRGYINEVIEGENDIDTINLVGKTDLAVLGHILKDAFLFLGVDSGPSHIAAAVKVPGVILFSGINDPNEWAPRSEKMRIIYPGEGKGLECVLPEEVEQAIDEVLAS